MTSETLTDKQNQAEASVMADNLIRQSQASAIAAEAINKAKGTTHINKPIRNIKKDYVSPGYEIKQPENPYNTTDDQYKKTAYQDKLGGPTASNNKNNPKVNQASEKLKPPTLRRGKIVLPNYKSNPKVLKQTLTKTALMKDRIKATQIIVSSSSWIGYLWLTIQLPFAILSLITLGIVAAVDSLGGGGFFSWVIGGVLTGINAITSVFGVDFTKISFNVFLILQISILAISMFSVFTLYVLFKIRDLEPFFGKGASFKIVMFLLIIIGCSMPLLNLFPFIFLWLFAVWWKPK